MKLEDIKEVWACKSVDDGELMHFNDRLTPQLFTDKFDAELAASEAFNYAGEDYQPVRLFAANQKAGD